MQVLNDAWAPHSISFDLLNVTYTQNATWSKVNFVDWFDMKQALRMGGYGTLNIYTVLLTEGAGLLGVSLINLCSRHGYETKTEVSSTVPIDG